MLTLRARYVFPVDAPPIADGTVTIAAERIVAVGPFAGQPNAHDLGNVALLPGLVNAHTHLEFSDLPVPLGRPGMPFPDWIRCVMEHRRGRLADQSAAVAAGLQECVQAGTTLVGEIATSGWPVQAFEKVPIDAVVFLELIGLAADRIAPRIAEAQEHLEVNSWTRRPNGSTLARGVLSPGISPHAPYSVHPRLLQQAAGLSWAHQRPLAMHLAESREELELLKSGGGPFRDLLLELGVWDPTVIPPAARPLDYLHWMNHASPALVIHGNYLDANERAFVAARYGRMSVVYCPRTHAYFGHNRRDQPESFARSLSLLASDSGWCDHYPLPELLAAGANVALGTDSRASNPDLSLLAEMRFVARAFPELARQKVLELGTQNGARALGQLADFGSLTPGKLASLAVVALPDREANDPHELLFDSDRAVAATIHRGRVVYGVEGLAQFGI